MGAALRKGLYDLQLREKEYQRNGISSLKPWVLLFTDGKCDDEYKNAAEKLRTLGEQKKINYLGIEIGPDADHKTMCELVPAQPGPVKLKDLRFQEFFRWLTDTSSIIESKNDDEQDASQKTGSRESIIAETEKVVLQQKEIPQDNKRKVSNMSTKWHGFSVSIPGSGHIRRGIPCQDASDVILEGHPSVIVCDGRGSASLSHYGARSAVKAFRTQCAILAPFISGVLDVEEAVPEMWTKFCRIMYRTLMQVKLDLAAERNCEEKEFDFTVAFAIAGEKHIGCFQVGDGALVISRNGEPSTVFMPEKGEYANQTHFLRPGGEEKCDFQSTLLSAEDVDRLSATSDGPEHLMFQLDTMTPGKIFRHLFTDLIDEELQEQDLRDYLTRREWDNDPRGTDDRSIAILGRDLPVMEKEVSAPEEKNSCPEVKNEETTVPGETVTEEKNELPGEGEGKINPDPVPAPVTEKAETESGAETAENESHTPAKEGGKELPDSRHPFSESPSRKDTAGKRRNGKLLQYRLLQYGRDLCLIIAASGLLSCALQIYEQKNLLEEHHHEIKEINFRLRKLLQQKDEPNTINKN